MLLLARIERDCAEYSTRKPPQSIAQEYYDCAGFSEAMYARVIGLKAFQDGLVAGLPDAACLLSLLVVNKLPGTTPTQPSLWSSMGIIIFALQYLQYLRFSFVPFSRILWRKSTSLIVAVLRKGAKAQIDLLLLRMELDDASERYWAVKHAPIYPSLRG